MMHKSDLATARHADEPKTRSEKPKQQSSKIQLNQISGFLRKYSFNNSSESKTARQQARQSEESFISKR